MDLYTMTGLEYAARIIFQRLRRLFEGSFCSAWCVSVALSPCIKVLWKPINVSTNGSSVGLVSRVGALYYTTHRIEIM